MNKNNILKFTSCLVIAYIFCPVFFENIPLPGLGIGTLLLYFISLVVFFPLFFFQKEMILIYFLVIIYFFLTPLVGNTLEMYWFVRRIIPLFLGVSLFVIYFKVSDDYNGMRFIFWFSFICIIISCLTTSIGLNYFSTASRDLAGGTIRLDQSLINFYSRIGIMGYGFISSIICLGPFLVMVFKSQKHNKKNKVLFSILILLFMYTIMMSQYATQFIIFLLVLIVSLLGNKGVTKNILIFTLISLVYIFLPKSTIANSILYISNIIPVEILSERLGDISESMIADDLGYDGTHVSYRYNRVPFLLKEFIKNPIFGGGETTGHVYWLDYLVLYGIAGMFPLVLLFRSILKTFKEKIKINYFFYFVSFLSFILLGFMKGSGFREQYIILFFILPLGLFLYENGMLFKKDNKRLKNER